MLNNFISHCYKIMIHVSEVTSLSPFVLDAFQQFSLCFSDRGIWKNELPSFPPFLLKAVIKMSTPLLLWLVTAFIGYSTHRLAPNSFPNR